MMLWTVWLIIILYQTLLQFISANPPIKWKYYGCKEWYVKNIDSVIGYPEFGYYKPNVRCTWDIDIDQAYYLNFTKLSVDYSRYCTYDWLRVQIIGETQQRFCGFDRPTQIVVAPHKTVYITFYSNSNTEYEGFAIEIRKATCSNIGCDQNAFCNWDVDKPKCQCSSGYIGDGFKCEKIGECNISEKNCHLYATCSYSGYRNKCICKSGYEGNGHTCSRISKSKGVSWEGIVIAVIIIVIVVSCVCCRNKAKLFGGATTTRASATTGNTVTLARRASDPGNRNTVLLTSDFRNSVRRNSLVVMARRREDGNETSGDDPSPAAIYANLSTVTDPPPSYPGVVGVYPPPVTGGYPAPPATGGYPLPPSGGYPPLSYPEAAYTPPVYQPGTVNISSNPSTDLPPPPSYESAVNETYRT